MISYYQYENLDGNPFKCSLCILNTETTNPFAREIFMHKFQMKQANLKGKLIYANDVMIVRTYLNRVQSYPYKNGKREKFIL